MLDRPAEQRAREYQYRFAQALVFGLPVIALQVFGRRLGGQEADRWVAVFQAVLAGWVVYVGAAGMLFEGLLWLVRRRVTADLLPSLAVVALYVAGLVRAGAPLLSNGRTAFPPGPFHWAVLILIPWVGIRWWWLARQRPARR